MCLNVPFSTVATAATYPSPLRIEAIASFMCECGISTRGCRARTAFRMRVSMSAIGSVIVSSSSFGLPAGLRDARDHPLQRQVAEADPAHLKLAQEPPRPAAPFAAVAVPDRELVWLAHRRDPGCRRHLRPASLVAPERHAKKLEGGFCPLCCVPRLSRRSLYFL